MDILSGHGACVRKKKKKKRMPCIARDQVLFTSIQYLPLPFFFSSPHAWSITTRRQATSTLYTFFPPHSSSFPTRSREPSPFTPSSSQDFINQVKKLQCQSSSATPRATTRSCGMRSDSLVPAPPSRQRSSPSNPSLS